MKNKNNTYIERAFKATFYDFYKPPKRFVLMVYIICAFLKELG